MEKGLNAGFEFIDELLLSHRVSLLALSDFADTHMEDLQQAENIFDLKEEKDEKLCLALFRLMAGKYASAISEKFCNKYHLALSSVDDLFFEKNKLFLLAAFVYNPSFFTLSWNLCGIIRSELAFEAESQKETEEPERSEVITVVFLRPILALAASGADETLEEIWSEDIDLDGIQGKLRILANNKDDAGLVEFRFKFIEYHSEPPYYLLVRYTTQSDGIEHTAELNTIAVNSSKKRELVIVSAVQEGIRYSGGLTITSMEVHKYV